MHYTYIIVLTDLTKTKSCDGYRLLEGNKADEFIFKFVGQPDDKTKACISYQIICKEDYTLIKNLIGETIGTDMSVLISNLS